MGLKGNKVDYYDLSGRRRRKTFPNKRLAEEFLLKLRLKEDRDEKVTASVKERKLIVDAIDYYFDNFSVRKESKALEEGYFREFNRFMKKQTTIGTEEESQVEYMDEIKLEHLRRFQTYLRNEKGLAASSVNRYFHTYRDFFMECDRNDWLVKNPIPLLKSLPEAKQARKPWTTEQIEQVLSTDPAEIYRKINPNPSKFNGMVDVQIENIKIIQDIVFAMASLGARNIEIARLCWGDITFSPAQVILRSKKGDGSLQERPVPMTPFVAEFFKEKFESARRKFRARAEDRVFLTATGSHINKFFITRRIRPVLDAFGMEEISAYGLRHQFVTSLRRIGAQTADISELAGHRNVNTTMGYSHVDGEHHRETMEKLALAQGISRKFLANLDTPPDLTAPGEVLAQQPTTCNS